MQQSRLRYVLKEGIFILAVLLLTLITQTGGILLILARYTFPLIERNVAVSKFRKLWLGGYFLCLYLLFTFLLVPLLAPLNGRTALPVFTSGGLRPHAFTTVLLNRHYVRPALKSSVQEVARKMSVKFPGTEILYLDANFPFINNFPLLPHLSHNDGRKLDLAFCYRDVESGEEVNDSPSWLGYGRCEEPRKGEYNAAAYCASKGYWMYSFLKKFVSGKSVYAMDEKRTRAMLQSLSNHNQIGTIFLEPHLKNRLGLTSSKIRFHGCQAVRHDDHIHIQL